MDESQTSLLSLPTELLQQVAICAWTTRDVLAFAHASSVLHGAITTPTVFQTRARDAGWSIGIWEEEARELSSDEALRLWIKADASCGAVVSMLSKAREPRFFEIPDTVYRVWYPRLTFTHWGTRLCDCGEDDTSALDDVFAQNGHLHLIDGERVWSWLTSFTGYFGHVLAHNSPRDPGNLNTILSLAGDGEVWQTILRTLLGLVHNRVLSQRFVILPPDFSPDLSPDLATILHSAFQLERFAMTTAYFILSCDLVDLERIFGRYREEIWPVYTARHQANNTARLTHERLFGPWTPTAHEGAYTHTVTETRRFSSTFLCVAVFFLDLRLSPSTGDTLSPPRLPSEKAVRLWSSSLPRHGLEGTPLANLPSDGERRAWGGYYGYYAHHFGTIRRRDPPMLLDLAVAEEQGDMIHLFGEGQDDVGPFTLSIRVARSTGLFDGIKSYTQHQIRWDWRGCVTPFGLAGRWGDWDHGGGPIWIWPRGWSED